MQVVSGTVTSEQLTKSASVDRDAQETGKSEHLALRMWLQFPPFPEQSQAHKARSHRTVGSLRIISPAFLNWCRAVPVKAAWPVCGRAV